MVRAMLMLTSICFVLMLGMVFVGGLEAKLYLDAKWGQIASWVADLGEKVQVADKELEGDAVATLTKVVEGAISTLGANDVENGLSGRTESIDKKPVAAIDPSGGNVDVKAVDVSMKANTISPPGEVAKVVTEVITSPDVRQYFSDPVDLPSTVADSPVEVPVRQMMNEQMDALDYERYEAELIEMGELTLQSLNLLDAHLGRN